MEKSANTTPPWRQGCRLVTKRGVLRMRNAISKNAMIAAAVRRCAERNAKPKA